MKIFLVVGVLAVSLVGCGGGSGSNPINPPAPVGANIIGQWSFLATDTANNQTAVFANFAPTAGSTFSAQGTNSATCDLTTAQCQFIINTPNISVTISPTDSVTVTLTNVINVGTGTTVTVTGTGTVNTAGTQMSGSWTSTSGDTGTWQGQSVPSFSGNYTGTVNSTISPSVIPVGVQLAITQDASFNLSGTAILTNSACFSTFPVGGHVVGGAFALASNGGNASVLAAGIQNPNPPGTLIFGYQIVSGICAGDVGQGTLTKQ